MALRPLFAPLRPDLDDFLFAKVGEEREGVPLSMISALTRLGLDPWDEAGRLSSLGKKDAIEQLRQLIAQLPGTAQPSVEGREIAAGLIELLPARAGTPRPPEARLPRRWRIAPVHITPVQKSWLICVLLVAAAVVSIIANGGLPFGNRTPAEQPAANSSENPR